MSLKLTFLGAAGNVTGSRYLLEINHTRLLVDCGLHQERELRDRDWVSFPVPPSTIDAVLLTHAHVDHCGLLPKFVRDGFRGRIYCTAATAELAEIILPDAAHLQQEDAEYKKMRHQREGRKGPHPYDPLYTADDARASFPLFSPVEYGQPISLGEGIRATFYDAGHVLGSTMVKLTIGHGKDTRTIVFSGDIGRWDRPILQDPTTFDNIDYILMESTYGDRLHEGPADISDKLEEIINATRRAGGNIIVPSFALERAQEILYYMNKLLLANRIPHMMVFLDSPMAINITEVFKRYSKLFDDEMVGLIKAKKSPFDFPGLKLVQTIEESKAINHIIGTIMIIAGSGMCTGGRIKHHLVTNISRHESTILFAGYQAVGTLGWQIVDGAAEVRILGRQYPVRAKIVQMHGLSAHADRDELYRWVSALNKAPRHLFVTHGEAGVARRFGEYIKEKTGWEVSVPEYGTTVSLD